MSSPPHPLETIGDYHVVRAVDAAGGLGAQVHLALKRDEAGAQQLYMIKLLTARGLARARALRELKQVRMLEHAAVATVREYFEHGRQLAVVFDYLDGLRLDQIQEHLQREHERLSDRAAWHICHQLAGALAEAHAAADDRGRLLHMGHGRLGPDQVQLSWEGQVRVFGIGLPSVFEDQGRAGVEIGYLPPERGGTAAANPQADVYGVAAITWSLLTGHCPGPPLPLTSLAELRPDLPSALCELFELALRPKAAQRKVSCQQLEQRLERAVDDVADVTELKWNMDVFKALALFSRSRPPPGSEPPDSDGVVPPPMSRPHSHWIEQPMGAADGEDEADLGDDEPQRESAFEGAENSVVERISSLFDDVDLSPSPPPEYLPGGAEEGPAATKPQPPRPHASTRRHGAESQHDTGEIEATEVALSEAEALAIEASETPSTGPAVDAVAAAESELAGPGGGNQPPSGRAAALPSPPAPSARVEVRSPAETAAAAAATPPALPPPRAIARASAAESAHAVIETPADAAAPVAAAPRRWWLVPVFGAAVLTGAVGFAAGWLLKPGGTARAPAGPAVSTERGRRITVDAPSGVTAASAAPGDASTSGAMGGHGAATAASAASASTAAGGHGAAAASATPSGSASAVASAVTTPPVASGDATKLLSYEGYLVVQSSVAADVYVQGKMLGPTNSLLKSRCYHRFVRLRDAATSKWLTAGQAVGISCMDTTTVRIEAAGH